VEAGDEESGVDRAGHVRGDGDLCHDGNIAHVCDITSRQAASRLSEQHDAVRSHRRCCRDRAQAEIARPPQRDDEQTVGLSVELIEPLCVDDGDLGAPSR
jgi:hypothetical protein